MQIRHSVTTLVVEACMSLPGVRYPQPRPDPDEMTICDLQPGQDPDGIAIGNPDPTPTK